METLPGIRCGVEFTEAPASVIALIALALGIGLRLVWLTQCCSDRALATRIDWSGL